MKIAKKLTIVDSHTMGEPTRILISGLPYISGNTMMEIKEVIMQNYDYARKILMLEPRGYSGMFGAIITPPVNKECHFGVIFMDTTGYYNMCGHGSIGIAKYAVEAGLVKKKYPETIVNVDTPAGKIELKVCFDESFIIKSISLINVKSFNYLKDIEIDLDGKKTFIDITYSGNFFAMVDADNIGLKLKIDNTDEIRRIGMKIMNYLRKNVIVQHPKNKNRETIDVIEFNSKIDLHGSHNKNVVILGRHEFDIGQVDRSPCGTGTAAKLANLYDRGKLAINDEFINESIIGTKFSGRVLREDNEDGINGIIPEVTGNAFITGYTDVILEEHDPLSEGFLI